MFIQVLTPNKLDWIPWYRVDDGQAVSRGMRVSVNLGRRECCGVIWSTGGTPEIEESRILPINRIETDLAPISETEMEFWSYLAGYYLCSLGEVFKSAYPASRIKSELTRGGRRERRTDGKAQSGKTSGSGKPLLMVGASRMDRFLELTGKCLAQGRSVLVLIPEIAISERLQKTFEEKFGDATILCNSSQTPVTRRRTAETLRSGEGPYVVIGTRCAVFLPFRELGLVIVDEEQDPSFKQTEPDPRMNVRDAALFLARVHAAEVVLGSSSPSLESLYNCRCGKFIFEGSLGDVHAPVIDISEERRKNGMKGLFSRKLIQASEGIEKQLIFIRGWEKAEELGSQIPEYFPGRDVRVLTAHEAIGLPDCEIRKAGLLAILQADALFPKENFRADERAYQLICRLCCTFPEIPLVIQTAKSQHPVFKALNGQLDLETMFSERKLFGLPPSSRCVDVVLHSSKPNLISLLSGKLSGRLGMRPIACGASLRFYFPRASAEAQKKVLYAEVCRFEKDFHSYVHIDVDPV